MASWFPYDKVSSSLTLDYPLKQGGALKAIFRSAYEDQERLVTLIR